MIVDKWTYEDLSSTAEFEHDRDAVGAEHRVLIGESDGACLAGRQSTFLWLDTKQIVVHHLQLHTRHTCDTQTLTTLANKTGSI